MPNIKSAKKRVLTNAKKNDQNRQIITSVKTAVKKLNNAIDVNDIALAEKLLPEVFSFLDSAVSKGVLHKNNAANKKSALSKKVNDVKTGKVVITIKKDNKTVAAEKAKQAQDARDTAKAEYQKAAAEKKAAKIEAEKARLEQEKAAPKKSKKDKEKEAEVKADKKPAAKKGEEKPAVEEKPVKKAAPKKVEEKPAAEGTPAKKPAAKKADEKPAAKADKK